MAVQEQTSHNVKSAAVVVADAATVLTAGLEDRRRVVVQNKGAASIWLGGSDVTTSNGVELAVDDVYIDELVGDAMLYGRAATGTVTVRVLEAD